MRVEWLDEDMDRARVVVGWFRKRAAVVRRQSMSFVSDRWYEHAGDVNEIREVTA